jgi:hypothetical protein
VRAERSTPVSEDKGVVGEDQPAADEDSKRVVQLKHHRVHLGFLWPQISSLKNLSSQLRDVTGKRKGNRKLLGFDHHAWR